MVGCLSDEGLAVITRVIQKRDRAEWKHPTAHPAVLVLAPWTDNLRTLSLMSLATELPPPLVGWYAIPDDGKFGEGRLIWHEPSICLERHDVPSQSHCAE